MVHKHNDNDKDVVQHGSHTPAHSCTVACSLGLQHTSDTGQSMSCQLTRVKTTYLTYLLTILQAQV